MTTTSTKQRYQLFRKVESISFDNIRDNIESMATPCSEVFELTGEEHDAMTKELRENYIYDQVELRCLYPWFETARIMANISSVIEQERKEHELRLRKQTKAEKKAAFNAQCKGKNGKVK